MMFKTFVFVVALLWITACVLKVYIEMCRFVNKYKEVRENHANLSELR